MNKRVGSRQQCYWWRFRNSFGWERLNLPYHFNQILSRGHGFRVIQWLCHCWTFADSPEKSPQKSSTRELPKAILPFFALIYVLQKIFNYFYSLSYITFRIIQYWRRYKRNTLFHEANIWFSLILFYWSLPIQQNDMWYRSLVVGFVRALGQHLTRFNNQKSGKSSNSVPMCIWNVDEMSDNLEKLRNEIIRLV